MTVPLLYQAGTSCKEMKKALIIGGSRFVGPLVMAELLKKNWDITVFNRGQASSSYPPPVRHIVGDRNRGFACLDHYDIVIDMCAYTGAQTERALQELSFDLFIHLGTAAAYQKSETFPLTEYSPLGPWPLWGAYNTGKVQCENALKKSGKPYASLRPVYILGKKNYIPRESFIYSLLKQGRPITIPGNGEACVQFVSADAVAATLALLAETKQKGVFNCAGDDYITLKGLVQEMAIIAGTEPFIRFNADADGDRFRQEEFPFANENFTCSNEKVKSVGASFMPLRTFLRHDYETYYKNNT